MQRFHEDRQRRVFRTVVATEQQGKDGGKGQAKSTLAKDGGITVAQAVVKVRSYKGINNRPGHEVFDYGTGFLLATQ